MYKISHKINYPEGIYSDDRLCFITECDVPARTLSLCNRHAKQIKNYGHILNDKEVHELKSRAAIKRGSPNLGKHWKIKDTSNMTGRIPPHKKRDDIKARTKIQRDKFRKTMLDIIFARDNYTCQFCGQYNGHLHVDHIESWAENPELRFDLNNCRTLCRACHYYITFKRKMPEGSRWGLTNMTRERG